MGRITGSTSSSYNHRIQDLGHGRYRLSWTIDKKYEGSRLRFPRGMSRDTDEKGAKRFAKRWDLTFPPVPRGSGAQ
jgi:hypothetical protein